MRVLLVSNGLGLGGAERVVECLAEDLLQNGDEVHVVAVTRGGAIATRLQRAGVAVTRLGLKSTADAKAVLRLTRLMIRFRPQVVHSHLEVSDALAWAASLPFRKIRRISTVHNLGHGALRSHLGRRLAWQGMLRRFDGVSAVSHAVLRTLPFLPYAKVVAPSLVRAGDSTLSRGEARRALGLPQDKKVVLTVGRLVRAKGLDILAEAAARLLTPDVQVAVVGVGPEYDALKRGGGLTLLGPIEHAERYFAAADVLVNASRTEGFPQVLLQAMAARVAVVATRVGGTSEIVVDQSTGLLVPPQSPQDLAEAIDRLLANPKEAGRMGTAGRARLIAEDLTREAMFRQTRMLYEEALAAPRRFKVVSTHRSTS